MPVDTGVALELTVPGESGWELGTMEPACLMVFVATCWGGHPGDTVGGGVGRAREAPELGSSVDRVSQRPLWDLWAPPLILCLICDCGGVGATGRFGYARVVVLGLSSLGAPGTDVRVSGHWLAPGDLASLPESATPSLWDRGQDTQMLWAVASSAVKWGNWPLGYFPEL